MPPPRHDADVERSLASTPICEGVPARAIRDLATLGTLRRYQRNTYLFHQEDDAEEVFLLCSGRVEIMSVSLTGYRQLHTTLEAPQFFGELGVLGEGRRTTSALAVDEAAVWVVKGDLFVRFLGEQPSASRALLRALARQVRAHEALVDDLLFLDLKGRVAKRLLGLVSPSLDEVPRDGALLPAVVTQADLASLAGGSRESVTRVLSDFQKRGIVGRSGKRYVLKDVKALRKLAGI
ncbi:MAG: Crp/Fnr family transcriptional regulator [Actinomycetota bacterium]